MKMKIEKNESCEICSNEIFSTLAILHVLLRQDRPKRNENLFPRRSISTSYSLSDDKSFMTLIRSFEITLYYFGVESNSSFKIQGETFVMLFIEKVQEEIKGLMENSGQNCRKGANFQTSRLRGLLASILFPQNLMTARIPGFKFCIPVILYISLLFTRSLGLKMRDTNCRIDCIHIDFH